MPRSACSRRSWQRDRAGGDGTGRTIDVALTESILSLMEGMLPEYGALGKVKQPTGGGIATAAPTNAYPTADGAWMLIAANREPLFARLMGLIGRTDLIGAPRLCRQPGSASPMSAALDAHDRRLVAQLHGADALEAMLTEADIPSSQASTPPPTSPPTRNIASAAWCARSRIPHFDDPVLHSGVVPHMVEAPGDVRWAGPAIGAHTDEVLGELLGMDDGGDRRAARRRRDLTWPPCPAHALPEDLGRACRRRARRRRVAALYRPPSALRGDQPAGVRRTARRGPDGAPPRPDLRGRRP